MFSTPSFRLGLVLLAALLPASILLAQAPAPAEENPPIKQEELEQILAPIALYPDSLLAQMFMASTYPLEVVEADRWMKANPNLKGEALTGELEKKSWDASVKSLINFPDVLSTMSDKLDITTEIGDAFIDNQQRVLNTVQILRAKANEQGNLKSNDQQTVVVEQAPQQTVIVQEAPAPPQVIKIESPSPQVVYVPTYDPTKVYGTWPYPTYPPPPYYPPRPPGYIASNVISFGLGVAAGAAWGYAWGGCDWGHGDVDIDVNRNTTINNNIDRSKYEQQIKNRQTNAQGQRANSFQHDPSHRQGVPYSNSNAAKKYNGTSAAQARQARDSYRGQGGAAQTPQRGGANTGAVPAVNRSAPSNQVAPANRSGAANQAGSADRAAPSRQPSAGAGSSANRSAPARNSSSAKSGALDVSSGSAARAESQRGQASRSASNASRSSGGGARSAGGGGGGRPGGGGGRR